MTDNERALRIVNGSDPLSKEYPPQDHPKYWEQVPKVFEKVFSNRNNLETFKANWITHRVPLYAMWKDDKQRNHNIGYVYDLMRYMLGSPKFDHYIDLLKEREIGHNEESLYLSQGTLIFDETKQTVEGIGLMRVLRLHNILSYQHAMNKDIAKDYDAIIEIGGGVGEFIKMAREMGFEGEYYGIDFKPMCDISAYNNNNHPLNYYYQTIDKVPRFDTFKERNMRVLVVGTWSFSEMTPQLRAPILERLNGADWLIGFQRTVFGVDNLTYFVNDFLDAVKPSAKKLIPLDWIVWNGGNFYLFCKQDIL